MGAATNIALCPLLFAGHPNRAAEMSAFGGKADVTRTS